MNTSISELESVASNDEIIESNGIASNDEGNEVDRNNEGNEIVSNDESEKKEDTDEKVTKISAKNQEKDTNEEKKETMREMPVRRSERVRKQRYNIHPDDIGNNDDEYDENYK